MPSTHMRCMITANLSCAGRPSRWRPHFAHSVNNDPIVGADLGVTLAARRAPTILQSSILRSFRMRAISWSCLPVIESGRMAFKRSQQE